MSDKQLEGAAAYIGIGVEALKAIIAAGLGPKSLNDADVVEWTALREASLKINGAIISVGGYESSAPQLRPVVEALTAVADKTLKSIFDFDRVRAIEDYYEMKSKP